MEHIVEQDSHSPTPKQNQGWLWTTITSKTKMHIDGGWFDIPNGWVTDAPGIVIVEASSWDDAVDFDLYMDGLVVGGFHNERFNGSCLQAYCPVGVTVSFGLSGAETFHRFAYLRLQR